MGQTYFIQYLSYFLWLNVSNSKFVGPRFYGNFDCFLWNSIVRASCDPRYGKCGRHWIGSWSERILKATVELIEPAVNKGRPLLLLFAKWCKIFRNLETAAKVAKMHPELKSGDRILILGNQEVWPKNLPPIFVEFNQCEMICSWHHGAVIVMVMTMSNIALMLMMFLLMIVRVVESARGLWRRRTLIRGLSLPHTCTRISTLAKHHESSTSGIFFLFLPPSVHWVWSVTRVLSTTELQWHQSKH